MTRSSDTVIALGMFDGLHAGHMAVIVNDCILCGCCSYECPSRRWLTASFKIVKQKLAIQAKQNGGKG